MAHHFDPGSAGGPVISDDPSGRWARRGGLAVLVLALVLGAVKVADWIGDSLEGDDDGVAADQVGEAIGDLDPSDDPSTDVTEGEGSETPTSAPTTVPAGPVDLREDATKPFAAFAQIFDGNPVRVKEIVLYEDWANIDVQVPDQPTYLDEYVWRGGDGVSGPEPQDLMGTEPEELEDYLFDLSELDPTKIPAMVDQGLAQFPEEGMEVTHVIIDRFLPFDTRVLIRVYVSHPERGGGGYVEFTPDGGFVETMS